MNNKRTTIIFTIPEEKTITEIIFDILKNNNLPETSHEAYQKGTNGEDSRLAIVRDALYILVEKKIPEEKLVELLTQHLKTSKEVAEKILSDLKQKLIPYAKIVEKIEEKSEPAPAVKIEKAPVGIKKPTIIDVEENAQKIKQVEEKKGPDSYREPIE